MKLPFLPLIAAGYVLSLAPWAGAQQNPPQPAETPDHPGTVIFSRSLDTNGSEPATPATPPAATASAADSATDAERQAVTFVAYDLDLHLQPREHAMAVRARLTVRNDSARPLRRLPLQLSSSLEWKSIHVADAPAPGGEAERPPAGARSVPSASRLATFSQKLVDSDSDHTGALREATIELTQPLAPGQSLALDVTYEGTAALATNRLENIGTPPDVAQASDWDRVADDFIGLRGFGNVIWYPVSSTPVALGDGAKFFTEAAAQRQRQSQATVAMRLTTEFFGEAPNVAILNGQTIVVKPASLPSAASVPGIVTCSLPSTRLGLASPSFFLLTRTVSEGAGLRVFAKPEDVPNAQAYMTAAASVLPLIHQWLGAKARTPLNIVDLPDGDDAPFEDGDVLFANVRSVEPEKLAGTLAHSLTHVYFHSPYAWLQEGVASFMASLWLEQTRGRDVAIEQLDNTRGALSLAEPGDTLESAVNPPQTLLVARDPVFFRTKATYVFWMLRSVAGDDALEQTLQAYQPGTDEDGTAFQKLLERTSSKKLGWFFDDWVYRDRGLPDLSIAGVFPNKASLPGAYIVAVDVSNTGTASAEVPVSVSSSTTTITDQVRVPPKTRVSHRFLLQGVPAEVAVNDGTVPEVEASVHKQTIAAPPPSESAKP